MTDLETMPTKKHGGAPKGYRQTAEHKAKAHAAHMKFFAENEELQARRKLLKELIEAGYTNQAAGAVLGVGKSAVSSMIYRMLLMGWTVTRPAKPVKPRAPKPFAWQAKKPTPPQPRQRVIHPPMAPVGLHKRTGCAFPVAYDKEHLFCNNRTHLRSPYCEFHGNLRVNRT